MDQGEETIEDERSAAESQSKARWINRRALITASVITLVALAFPRL